jgi:branched-chain amino acid transport system substrate-binding protein
MKTRIKQMVIVLLALVMFGACNNKKDVITLGVIAPLTGNDADYGFYMKSGLELALADINAKNEKVKIELIFQDDQANNTLAMNGFKYLNEIKKVPLIFGPAMSGTSRALKDEANKNKVILFSSISTNDSLRYAGEYYFRNIARNEYQVKSIADYFIKDKNLKNAAVLIENTPNGINMFNGFDNYFTKLGGVITISDYYDENQSDFRNILNKINKQKFEFLLIAGGTVDALALITKQLRESGNNAVVVTGDGFQGESIIRIAGKAANGVISTRPAVQDTTNIRYKEFVRDYQTKYKKSPGAYAVLSYDALMHVYEALKNIKGEVTGELFKNSLLNTSYNGINGYYQFDNEGEVDKPYGIFEYKNGNYNRLK